MAARVSVKKTKLTAKPVTKPRGFFLPPATPEESTIGKIGQIQGAKIVTIPDKNVKKSSTNIQYIWFIDRKIRNDPLEERELSRPHQKIIR